MADRFDKFTERARQVLSLAQEEAQRFNHNYIGTEHLLLGLVREGEGIAAGVLESLGVSLERVRVEITRILSQSMPQGGAVRSGSAGTSSAPVLQAYSPPATLPPAFPLGMALTPQTGEVVALAWQEAQRLNHEEVRPQHLLLALMRGNAGIAALLQRQGTDLDKLRTGLESLSSDEHPGA